MSATIDAPAAGRRLTQIRPPLGWRLAGLGELWRARELVYYLAWRDVRVRYRQTAMGAAWAVLQPALMMAVFTAFFGSTAGAATGDIPYPLFACAGLLPWTLFAGAVTASANSVVGSERLITKVYFPRLAIPLAAVGPAVVDFAVALGLLAAMMAYYGVAPGPGLVFLPVVVALIVLAAVGLGTLLAALSVAYRDFRHVTPFLIQLGLFATPTVFMTPRAGASVGTRLLLGLNPMTALVSAARATALGGPIPWAGVATSAALVALVLAAGCLYFRKTEDGFADLI